MPPGLVHILDQIGSPLSLAVQQRAIIARQTGQLARLVDGVLEVHRLISRRLVLRREPFDLVDILGHVESPCEGADAS